MSSTEMLAEPASRPAAAPTRPPRPARRVVKPQVPPVDDRAIRKFGIVMIVGFGLIGGFLYWRAHPTAATVLWSIGGAVGLLALAAPGPARPVHRLWMKLAHILGRINTTILLSVFYGVMFGVLALVFRLIGRDALHRRFDRDAKTYWEPKRHRTDARSYLNQF